MTSREAGALTTLGPTGIGLRAPHVDEVMVTRPAVGWLEVHAENYMGGGPALAALERIRRAFPIALHGVGLSLATAEGLDRRHLERLSALAERIQPVLISEHLAWSVSGGTYLSHLLPLPYDDETLGIVARHVDEMQARLARRVLIENPSSYLRFRHSTVGEAEFLAELARRTGCGLLCDVNNVFVSGVNLGFDPAAYLDALPAAAIGEIHLAGHSGHDADGRPILIDDHGSPVADAVWALYAGAVRRFGPVPTLVEWDTDLPALSTLLDEARRADDVRRAVRERAGDVHPA